MIARAKLSLEGEAIGRVSSASIQIYPPSCGVDVRVTRGAPSTSISPMRPLRPAPTAPPQPQQLRQLTSAPRAPSAPSAPARRAEAATPLLPTVDMLPLCASMESPQVGESGRPQGKDAGLKEVALSPSARGWLWDNLAVLNSRVEERTQTKMSDLKLFLLILFLCFLGVVFLKGLRSNPVKPVDATELDDYFRHLNYSSDHLLVYKGETLQTIPKEGILDFKNCIVIERRKQTISNGNSEIGVEASNEHRTFPGSLLLANSDLVDNAPDVLVVGRAPLTYTVNLPGLTKDASFTIEPSFGAYQAAVNKVLNTWFDRYPSERSVPANFQSVESFAFSKQLLRIKFGLDFFNSIIESSIDFDAMRNGEKAIKIYKFTQVFYTVSVESPKKPSDLFVSGVDLNEIKMKTDEENPPVLVDSVSYGRNIYVKIETTSTEKQGELVVSFMDSRPGLQLARDLKNLNIHIYVIGGHPNQTELIQVTKMDQVHDIIAKFSTFSKHNLGFPVSYSSQFIKDNKKAVVHLTTDYVETLRHNNCQKGIIKLIQRKWMCKWEVTWTEYRYKEDGSKVAQKRGWDKNGQVIALSFESQDIEVPSYVEDLRVVVKAHTLLDSWHTLIDRSNIPIIPRREFYVYGDLTSYISPPLAK